MTRVFFVLRGCKQGDAPFDTLSGTHSTLAEATEAAQAEWEHTTDRERKADRLTVCHIDTEDSTDAERALEIALSEGYYCDDIIEEDSGIEIA